MVHPVRALTALLAGGLPSLYAQGVTAPAAPPVVAAATPLVFRHVTVIDVREGQRLPNRTVVVVGNRIQAVTPAGEARVPSGAHVVDARGKYLIPGLWDLHVHTTADFAYPLLIANGITGIRDGWSFVPLDTLLGWQREILAGTRVGPPRQLHTGSALSDIPIGRPPGGRGPELQRQAASLEAAGASFLKIYHFSFDAVAAARSTGLPFGGHVVNRSIPAMDVSDSGMRILDHVNAAGDLPERCLGPTASVERCRPIAERFRQNGTWWVPTLTKAIPRPRERVPLQPGPRAIAVNQRYLDVASRFWADSAALGNWLRDVVRGMSPDSVGFFSILQRVGLPVLAGSDMNVGPCCLRKQPPGFSLHAELGIYVTEGLPPLEALQSATLNPAKLLNATDSLGTVAPGKLADLVLLDGDPLVDITNTTAIHAVVANGRYFNRATLDQLLAEVRTRAFQGFVYWWRGGQRKTMTIDETP